MRNFLAPATAVLLVAALSTCTADAASAGEHNPCTANPCIIAAPDTYYWQVPSGVTKVHIKIAGAQGAGEKGGGGGFTEADLVVEPGEKLQLGVGGRGKWGGEGRSGGSNGGGEAADWGVQRGGGGGGETDVIKADSNGKYSLSNALIVVGGGGGRAYDYAGGGGGGGLEQNGLDGQGPPKNTGDAHAGLGATTTKGGEGAIGWDGTGCKAPDGSKGKGGDGYSCGGEGGGGGGGWFGGGGGTNADAGGGGSAFNSAAASKVTGQAGSWKDNKGNGQITISWTPAPS